MSAAEFFPEDIGQRLDDQTDVLEGEFLSHDRPPARRPEMDHFFKNYHKREAKANGGQNSLVGATLVGDTIPWPGL